MATQSIFRSIVINTEADAERFVTAIEKAAEASKNYIPHHVAYEDVKGEEIRKLLGDFIE